MLPSWLLMYWIQLCQQRHVCPGAASFILLGVQMLHFCAQLSGHSYQTLPCVEFWCNTCFCHGFVNLMIHYKKVSVHAPIGSLCHKFHTLLVSPHKRNSNIPDRVGLAVFSNFDVVPCTGAPVLLHALPHLLQGTPCLNAKSCQALLLLDAVILKSVLVWMLCFNFHSARSLAMVVPLISKIARCRPTVMGQRICASCKMISTK